MKREKFVLNLYNLVSTENIEIYKNLFENTDTKKVKDDYWKSALSFYNKLSNHDKKMFFEILRQISIDTTSNILAILDGVTYMENQDDDFNLSFVKTRETINGELQDLFLEIIEEKNQ